MWWTTSSFAAEVGVLVLQRVEAVRAGRDDRLHAALLLVAVERRGVLLGEHREEELVAGAPRGIARAGLLLPEDREVDARLLQQLRRRARDLLRAIVVARRAADPVEHRRVGFSPIVGMPSPSVHAAAIHARQVPRVAVGLDGLERLLQLVRELALHHHEVAAHVDDLVDVRDHHRALLLAGAAGRAGPEHVGVDDVGDEVDRLEAGSRGSPSRPGSRWRRRPRPRRAAWRAASFLPSFVAVRRPRSSRA